MLRGWLADVEPLTESPEPPGAWPAALSRFVELFDAGHYWQAHEALEDHWRETRSDFYQGLIIYASAFVHARRGNPRGLVRQLEKVPRYLGAYAPSHMGIDVAAILQHAGMTRACVRAAGMPEGQALQALISWPKLGPARPVPGPAQPGPAAR